MECDNCEKEFNDGREHFMVTIEGRGERPNWICSPSCLVEWAWKLKDGQEKLSKSRSLIDA